jgi:hypothetical protein
VFYEIPFTKRAQFESAWPHLLKVKSQGAPVILVRGPSTRLGTRIDAGVRIQSPPRQTGGRIGLEAPIDTTKSTRLPVRERWIRTTFIELVVDGEVVNLNRIPLPENTPIIDKRFEDRRNEPTNRTGGPSGIEGRRPHGERSLEQRVAAAQVIVVATALNAAPAPPKRPGDLPEVLVRFRVMRVLKGDLSDKVITTRTPTAAVELIGKGWVIMLSPEFMAGKHQFAGCNWIKAEPEVEAILSKDTK